MYRRRLMMKRLLALAAVAVVPAGRAMAQYYPQQGYPQQGYPPPPPYGGGPEGRVAAIQRERNRRVLVLQEQLSHGQIGRRQFNEGVAEIDREMNARIYGR
jgi:hypothetical protein